MVRALLLFLLLLSYSALSAQLELSVVPNPVHGTGSVDQTDIEAYVTIANTSDLEARLLWTVRVLDSPDNWLSWICDTKACYDPTVRTAPAGRTNDLAPGESLEFQVHVNPLGVDGFAQIEVDIFDETDTSAILAVVQSTFETSSTTSTRELDNSDAIRLYPNPTSGYFRIFHDENVDEVEVYNVIGKRLLHFPASPDGQYDVQRLPEGMYLVRLLSSDHGVIKTVRLSKN